MIQYLLSSAGIVQPTRMVCSCAAAASDRWPATAKLRTTDEILGIANLPLRDLFLPGLACKNPDLQNLRLRHFRRAAEAKASREIDAEASALLLSKEPRRRPKRPLGQRLQPRAFLAIAAGRMAGEDRFGDPAWRRPGCAFPARRRHRNAGARVCSVFRRTRAQSMLFWLRLEADWSDASHDCRCRDRWPDPRPDARGARAEMPNLRGFAQNS